MPWARTSENTTTAAPFQQGPDPALGTAGAVAHWTGAALGAVTVLICGMPAARAGDLTKHCNPSSMGPFAIAMGVAGVVAGGAGALAKNDSFAMAQAIADAAVLALKLLCGKDPSGPPGMGVLTVPFYMNVMIGGFPCPPIGEMAFGGVLEALQKAARGLKKKFSSKRNSATTPPSPTAAIR
jgi:uncharacterized Zn-binding protein involved in type VI secretion